MHLRTESPLAIEEVRLRFKDLEHRRPGACYIDAGREPQKFFLASRRAPLTAAAELAIEEAGRGSVVSLRLMWGPLPAPVARALVVVGAVFGLMLVAWAPASAVRNVAALLCASLPLAALWLQQRGEREVLRAINLVVDGAGFEPDSR